ncbi:MAG TPA: alpha/beta hydrolase [Chthoniobacterales bacterium]|nr:alpha/beta hydrolase [Chthoniobacterales bacterium]
MNGALDFVHQFIPGSSERTLLLLHGTGGNEHQLIPLGRELDPTAALLSPRGKVLENGYARFFRRLAEGVFDLEDLQRRTDELAEFVLAAAAHYQFAVEKVAAVGYSNGANIAASILLRRPGLLQTAVLLRAMVPFLPEKLPDLSTVRVWIGGGKLDAIIAPTETERLVDLLQAAGAKVSAHFFDAGHGLTKEEFVLVSRWLAL